MLGLTPVSGGPIGSIGDAAAPPLIVSAPEDIWIWKLLPPRLSLVSQPTTMILPWRSLPPSGSWRISKTRPRQEIYICVLTGGHVDLPDVELPISSWQGRLRDVNQTYVSVVVPNAMTYEPAVTSRLGGKLKVFKGYRFIDSSGGRFLALVAETNLTSLRHDTGGRSSSLTLVGYASITNQAVKSVAIQAVTYKSMHGDGKRRWRTNLHLSIDEIVAADSWDFIPRPGDTVDYKGESMVVGFISLAVSINQEIVEMVEA